MVAVNPGSVRLNEIVGRIRSIEQRFTGTRYQPVNEKFISVLTQQEKALPAHEKPLTQTGRSENEEGIASLVCKTAEKYGVDPKLALAVAQTESALRKDAISPAGAVGVMQLMPDTAKGLGVGDIHDPQQNIEGGVKYIKQMLGRFNGDVSKALAAYNAGPTAVDSYQGVPPYQETQEYVNKILSLVR